jgi:hypothetical protein
MLRHKEGFVVRKLLIIKENSNIKAMFIVCVGFAYYGVLPVSSRYWHIWAETL